MEFGEVVPTQVELAEREMVVAGELFEIIIGVSVGATLAVTGIELKDAVSAKGEVKARGELGIVVVATVISMNLTRQPVVETMADSGIEINGIGKTNPS